MPSYRAKPAEGTKPATKPKMPMHWMPESHAHMTPEEHKQAMAKMAKKGKK